MENHQTLFSDITKKSNLVFPSSYANTSLKALSFLQ